jgi:DMSO/TMAO reductase YedYZ heme-binding membrane subunit
VADRALDVTLDHTLTWEVARVGGLVAYVLLTASVALGLLLSLKVNSGRWPRFITNGLHRFVTLVALLFTGIHSIAVLLDPFTGFTPAEVLLPLEAHYRPLWIAMGIVATYLLLAVWGSDYVRKRVGYAWWRRFHYLSFAAFALGTLHGLGTGSDTAQPWALALYGSAAGVVAVLVAWRLVRAIPSAAGDVAAYAVGAALLGLATFTVLGPMQSGWNAIANSGNGNGASAAWLAAHPAVTASAAAPTTTFDASVVARVVADNELQGTFSGEASDVAGTLQLIVNDGSGLLELVFDSGWMCDGQASLLEAASLSATCASTDGATVSATLSNLRRSGQEILGKLEVRPISG